MSTVEITPTQRKQLTRMITLGRFLEAIPAGEDFLKFQYALIFKMYHLNLEGKYLSRSEAYACVIGGHFDTRRKYFDKALAAGYFSLGPHPKDGRKKLVKPTAKLIDFVEAEIDKLIVDVREILARS